MLIPTRLRVVDAMPDELLSILLRLKELQSTVESFMPVTLCTRQHKVDSNKLLWFIQHPDEINARHTCYVLNSFYAWVFKTSIGLYVYDGNHRANAALMTRQRLKVHYIDLTK